MKKANFYAFLMIAPIGIILGIPYFILHGLSAFNFKGVGMGNLFGGALVVLLIFFLGILMHELLHGVGWALFTKRGWRSIRFGVHWEYLTPYCHCSEPLKKWMFTIGAVLPCIILGMAPAVISYINGSFSWWFFGFFFTISAGGDIQALWLLRKVSNKSLIKDHPSELGFTVSEPEN